jgi:hydrogenase maturation protein HypF
MLAPDSTSTVSAVADDDRVVQCEPNDEITRGPARELPITIAAYRIEVRGVVQGVGFRPFVWRLASGFGLVGTARNLGGSVEVIVQGERSALDSFVPALQNSAPPHARVENMTIEEVATESWASFDIVASGSESHASARLVPPDVAPCSACLTDLWDPTDRRHRYPFVNCSDCGPRFTIIDALPYDRARTSMSSFTLCASCAAEYFDPANRRFHAEPIACPRCGPHLALLDGAGEPIAGDAIAGAADALVDGRIVAIKGVGGYQLACDATDQAAVDELRRRKARPGKPFAVMVADVAAASTLCWLEEMEVGLLTSWQAPIVLLRDRGRLAPSVAPGHRHQGLMLPSTPLHHLLLRATSRPLVMTSGNRSDEPICIDDVEALERLAGIADAFLVHDRRIVSRCDDSVVAVRAGAPTLLRRARGWSPDPIRLPIAVRPVLAVGAQLQSTFCLTAADLAHVSQHIGDLDDDAALAAYVDALHRHRRLLDIQPEIVAHDLHPDLLSTRLAQTLGLPLVAVQHHHAHVVSVMGEHGLRGPVIGVAFDGFGLGTDGTGWGGEFFIADWMQAKRVGSLRPVRQPGGDTAVRHPWRMALAHGDAADRLAQSRALLADSADPASIDIVLAQARAGLAAPWTSSVGRLFDAVAALTGVCTNATYEAQPAVLLEEIADTRATEPLRYAIADDGERFLVDARPLVGDVVDQLIAGASPAEISGRFHHTIAAIILAGCRLIRDRSGLTTVCLAGGVFANDILCRTATRTLSDHGFTVYMPRQLPPGDGGLCLGQALVAHAHHPLQGEG